MNVEYSPDELSVALFVRDRCGLRSTIQWPPIPATEITVGLTTGESGRRLLGVQWQHWWTVLQDDAKAVGAETMREIGLHELAAVVEGFDQEPDAWAAAQGTSIRDRARELRGSLGSSDGLFPGRRAALVKAVDGLRAASPLVIELELTVLPLVGATGAWLGDGKAVLSPNLFFDYNALGDWLRGGPELAGRAAGS